MCIMKHSNVTVARKGQEASIPYIVQRWFMGQLIRSLSNKCGCGSYDVGPWALFSSPCNRMIMSSESFVSIRYIIMCEVLKTEHSKNEE